MLEDTEEKHAKVKFPQKLWDIESIIAYAIGDDNIEEMSPLERIKLRAQLTLGLKALDQQPKHIDPASFEAALVTSHMLREAVAGYWSSSQEASSPRLSTADEIGNLQMVKALQHYADQSEKYIKGVEVNFGQSLGQRR